METAGLAAITVMVLLFLLSIVANLVVVCEPHEVVILSGFGGGDGKAGTRQGYRILHGGRKFRIPWIERVDRLDMRLMPIEITVENAYSEGGIPLDIRAIANVKISSHRDTIGNAIERFLGMPRSEIEGVAKETLEGNLRGVLATMTPEEVNEDRLKFSSLIQNEVEDDFEKMGLVVDTLKIQNVHDRVDYLDSISRVAIAVIQKEAAVAESEAQKQIGNSEADCEARVKVAQQKADMAIKQKQNELAALESELRGQIEAEMERTEASGREAKAQAEKKLQEIRSRLEELRLKAEVVLPAEARREADRLAAEGEAALISERGRATAEAFATLSATWSRAGGDAREIYLLQKLDDILEEVSQAATKVKTGSVNLIDCGDGRALPSYVASYPAIVGSVLREVETTLGVDLSGRLGGREGTSSSGNGSALSASGEGLEPSTEADTLELTSDAVFTLVVREIARDRKLDEHEKALLPRIATILGVGEDVQARVLGEVRQQVDADKIPSGGRPSGDSIYAKAYYLAVRDRRLTPEEKELLARLSKVLKLNDESRQHIEGEVLNRVGIAEAGIH